MGLMLLLHTDIWHLALYPAAPGGCSALTMQQNIKTPSVLQKHSQALIPYLIYPSDPSKTQSTVS